MVDIALLVSSDKNFRKKENALENYYSIEEPLEK